MSKFDFSKTIGGQILADSLKGWGESLSVPNDILPDQFKSGKGSRKLSVLEKMCDKRDGVLSQHAQDKATKARNIAKLRQQFENGQEEFDYDVCECNDTQLNRNMIAVVSALMKNEE
jgi:hypothetical protein